MTNLDMAGDASGVARAGDGGVARAVGEGVADAGDEGVAGVGGAGAQPEAAAARSVELLYWSGCPSHPRALAELREAMAREGLDPEAILVREIDSEAHARAERFVGSPTIRIDGRDVRPPGPEEPYGLTCRVYHRRDGRISPTPDPADVRDALRATATR